jgi:hypothetical protein
MKKTSIKILGISAIAIAALSVGIWDSQTSFLEASSHREAPLIANDPLADNTDLYAFRSPDDTNTVTIIANYIPLQLPQGGPNYASFGEDIRYEIHVENNGVAGDDITYRFTFSKVNQDPSTFFNIRLGQQNLKTTYTLEKRVGAGAFVAVVNNGIVPPPNIGPRSISDAVVGLGAPTYESLRTSAIVNTAAGEQVYCGPADDPFFVDLGGIFDLGQTRAGGTGINTPVDGVANKNVHSIAIKIPISMLQKDGKNVTQAANILDGDFVIGVWASASRKKLRTLAAGGNQSYSGTWVQVSRIGMPLTNEAVIPIGDKDKWNACTPYNEDPAMEAYFTNPELALYMDDSQFGGAVPAFADLRIQSNSLQGFDFRNGKDGLYSLLGNPAVAGTALDAFGGYLLRPNAPRSVDILPIFHTGVPNLIPYQLATGKAGNPLAAGKPFINNFLPTFGDMLRLNMAVPVTPRNSPDFSSEGIVAAAVLGLTDARFNTTTDLQFIPNMDGFPNGRRLEDDVTRIELQAVSGVALAAIGLWYDDYIAGAANPVTPDLVGVLSYTTGVETNDTTFRAAFPYVQTPWSGYSAAGGPLAVNTPANGTGCYATKVESFTQGLSKNNMPVAEIRSNTSLALNAPQPVVNNVVNFVSLGFGGTITLSFDGPIANGPGADIRISEATFGNKNCNNYKEQAEVFASQNGCDFIYIGTVCTNGGSLDLGPNLPAAEFIRIHDISKRSDFTDPLADGYDVNGIECLNGAGTPTDNGLVAGSLQDVVSFVPGLRKNNSQVPMNRRMTDNVLGNPGGSGITFVSLGFGGTLVAKFDYVVFNAPGADLNIVETSFGNPSCANYPEKARFYGSKDGISWTLLGEPCQDGTIDLGELDWLQYVKIEDTSPIASTRFNGTADGYDLDGITTVLQGCNADAKISNPTADNVNTQDDDIAVSVYPNPVRDLFNISVSGIEAEQQFTLELIDATGRLVMKRTIMASARLDATSIGVSELEKGIYQVVLRSESGTYTTRIVK